MRLGHREFLNIIKTIAQIMVAEEVRCSKVAQRGRKRGTSMVVECGCTYTVVAQWSPYVDTLYCTFSRQSDRKYPKYSSDSYIKTGFSGFKRALGNLTIFGHSKVVQMSQPCVKDPY